MDIKQLRALIYISDCGSLTRAAEVMRTSQPALSQQIKTLEVDLGVELLRRHARGVTLTDMGRLFCEHARTILKDIDRAKQMIATQAKDPAGKVSVGLPTSACRGVSAHLIGAVAKRYSNLSLHIIEAMTGTLDEWVQLGRLDVALLYDHKAFENVAWTEMMVEDLMLVARTADPILKRRSVRFSELESFPIVLPGAAHVLRNIIDHIAAREGIKPNVVIESDSLTAISQLVKSGYMTIMPHFAMVDEIKRGEMNAIRITNPTPSWRMSVVVSKRTINAQSSEAVAGILAEVIHSMVKSGVWKAKLRADT
mgnify:CR=1 FL=1